LKTVEEAELLLDLGLQPISNRFLVNPNYEERLFPLKLGQCQESGVIYLIDPVPYKELVPRFDWITYNEPEGHLDDLVDKVYQLFPHQRLLKIGGVSFKDDSTLERFYKKGFKTWRIDLEIDLAMAKHVGVESIQAALDVRKAKKIVKRYGKADLLVVRHIWEHVYDQNEFAEALKLLINEDGFIFFEVPDCTKLLGFCDYTMIWEEHLYYYTPYTFIHSLKEHGFEILETEIIPYPYENSIIALVKKGTTSQLESNKRAITNELRIGNRYAEEFHVRKNFIVSHLSKLRKEGSVALFGAGHMTCAFIDYFSVGKYIDSVLDDNFDKQGLYMPKSKVPVLSSDALYSKNISLCLLALNPIHEEKIISKHKDFLQTGGMFRSIYPTSKYSIFNEPLS